MNSVFHVEIEIVIQISEIFYRTTGLMTKKSMKNTNFSFRIKWSWYYSSDFRP